VVSVVLNSHSTPGTNLFTLGWPAFAPAAYFQGQLDTEIAAGHHHLVEGQHGWRKLISVVKVDAHSPQVTDPFR
jgi:hypothetical protein